MQKKKLVVLTGAGISAESGLQTFRDHDGLWMGHRVEDVATPEAFDRNPSLVMEFYNQRRRNVLEAKPNPAHLKLAELDTFLDVQIITQNVDDLHERAGSKHVLHLHGEILKRRSTGHSELVETIYTDMSVGEIAPDGGIWRPHIVWFGESVPMMENAADIVEQSDALLIIGTSLQVYPAAGLVHSIKPGTPIFILDRKIPEVHGVNPIYTIEDSAVAGIDAMVKLILETIANR